MYFVNNVTHEGGDIEDQPIYSPLSGDPEFQDLLEDLVADLPVRATRIHDHLAAGQLSDASDLIHQLKAAVGIYGFIPIYEAANQLDERVNNQQEGIVETAKDLIAICKRATSEAKPA
ncbi:MAG: hypothetical protein CMJ95_07210 [Planctomycetes bacterium]|nr:hypothetical protein [Planctomycetota bacterium]